MDDAKFKSPIPVPQFYDDRRCSISKKIRTSTPYNRRVPPKPPSKTVPSVSRLFQNQSLQDKPVAISFKDNIETSHILDEVSDTNTASYFEKQFYVDRVIGSGSFGDVFRVKSKSDGRYYAVKKSRHPFKGRTDRDHKLKEVAKHELIPKHPNLVEFIKAWEEKSILYIQIELCECSLLEFIENYREMNETTTNQPLPEELVWNFFIDLLMAVSHLHSHDLIHLDIKPENVFISKGICKLGDFGLMVDLNQKEESDHAIEGDPKYMAKELMKGKFSKSADIFSLGISMLEISCDLDLPSGGYGWHNLRSGSIPYAEFNCQISPTLRHVISIMMSPDPNDRPTASYLLSNSPVVKSVAKKRVLKVTFVEISKKLRNFFLLILHYLSMILFVDYFHDIIATEDGSHDDSNDSIVSSVPMSDSSFAARNFKLSPIHLNGYESFEEDDDQFLGISPLPKAQMNASARISEHRYELRPRKSPGTANRNVGVHDTFDMVPSRQKGVTSPVVLKSQKLNNLNKSPRVSNPTIHLPPRSKVFNNQQQLHSSMLHPDSPAVLSFTPSALLGQSSVNHSPNGMTISPKHSPRMNISHGSSYDFSDDEDTNESLLEPNIGPKNLMSIFEQMEKEEKIQ